jgi:hypothetical protein
MREMEQMRYEGWRDGIVYMRYTITRIAIYE